MTRLLITQQNRSLFLRRIRREIELTKNQPEISTDHRSLLLLIIFVPFVVASRITHVNTS